MSDSFHEAAAAGFPRDFGVERFTTSAEEGLSAEFRELQERNAITIATFDPQGDIGEASISLATDPVLEKDSPQVAAAMRASMLRSLDLHFRYLEEGDPNRFFQFDYADATVQMRRHTRNNGSSVIVYTCVSRDQDGQPGDIEICLLSDDEAARRKREREDRIAELYLDKYLHEEFGLDPGPLDSLSLQAKRDLLDGYQRDLEAAQDLKTRSQDEVRQLVDDPELTELRSRMIRGAMPRTKLLALLQRARQKRDAAAYRAALENIIAQHNDLSDKEKAVLLEHEQSVRLLGLDELLGSRRREGRIGRLAVNVALDAVVGSGTFMVAEIHTPAEVALVLAWAAAGLSFVNTLYRTIRFERVLRSIKDFGALGDERHLSLSSQLTQERNAAASYASLLDPLKPLYVDGSNVRSD